MAEGLPYSRVFDLFREAAARAAEIDPYFGAAAVAVYWRGGAGNFPPGTIVAGHKASDDPSTIVALNVQTARLAQILSGKAVDAAEDVAELASHYAKQIHEQTPSDGGPVSGPTG